MNNLLVLLGIVGVFYYNSSQNISASHIRVKQPIVSWDMNYAIRDDNCTNATKYDEGVACSTCDLITGVIKHEIDVSNKTIIEVETLVHALCKALGTKPAAHECFIILDDINVIAQLIERGLDPGAICCKLGFCNATEYIKIE